MRAASRKINEAITALRYPHLIGDWKSVYPLTFEDGCPIVDEILEVRPGRNGLIFANQDQFTERLLYRFGLPDTRSADHGQVEVSRGHERHGGRIPADDFSPTSDLMSGYFTTPDTVGSVVFATWVMAKMTGADEATVNDRIRRGQDRLARATFSRPTAPGTSA